MNKLKILAVVVAVLLLQACRHPLAIEGEGDIVDVNNSGHGCTLEQFQAQDTDCTENEVSGDYFVNYKAEPRLGWRFVRWDGPCSPNSDFQHCRLDASQVALDWWDETYPDAEIPPSTAVFEPITGNTGFLIAPTVAGVAWETPTQQGVTGFDGSFQYEEGEAVRFMVGDTLLGEIPGQTQVTPFDLAGSPVITGTPNITKALDTDGDPFHAVINIAVFLQSLDHDADPGNGIQIKPGIAAFFGGVSLDVSQHWETFRDEFGLRHAIGQANTKRRFSEAHGVANPAPALQHLYETLGIDARTLALNMTRWDENGDGTPDAIETRQYDANGNLTRATYDNEAPDSPYAIETRQYDANGNETRHEKEGWGWPDQFSIGGIGIAQYDAYGNVTHSEMDVADGLLVFFVNSEYDANGDETRREEGRDADRTTYGIITRQYDANGNETRREEDRDADGTPEVIETWQYDASGNETRWEYDRDGDGTPDEITTHQYDANGNLTHEYDEGGDGTPDRIKTWQYDANGHRTSAREEVIDDDGTPDYIQTWQYNANGNVTRNEWDYDGDGLSDQFCQYQYDIESNLTQQEGDCTEDGTPNRIVTYDYVATGWSHIFAD
jgi:hypothetical protein